MMRKMTIATVATLLAAIQAVAAPAGDKTPSPLSDKQIERRIAAHRTAEVVLTVTDSAGKPLTNVPITVRQVRHKFLFGADCIKAGVDFDVIGIQSHMHKGYWGAKRAWDVCRRFAKFKKPLHFTELTILSGPLKTDNDWHKRRTDWHTSAEGEKLQADQVAEFYRAVYSHPAVEAITWWDFSDNGAWQGAPAGLVRKDMSPKGAYRP